MSIKVDPTITRAVENAPNYQRKKSPLQRVVQMLKRHRDLWIEYRSTYSKKDKPISVIITTLAAKAYAYDVKVGEIEILQVLQTVAKNMLRHMDGENRVSNPVNEHENFADKWVENPQRRECFMAWREDVLTDLNTLNSATTVGDVWEALALFLGAGIVAEARRKSMLTIH